MISFMKVFTSSGDGFSLKKVKLTLPPTKCISFFRGESNDKAMIKPMITYDPITTNICYQRAID